MGSRRAAREAQKRHVLRVGRGDLEVLPGIGHELVPVEGARQVGALGVFADHDDMLQVRQTLAVARHLAPVEAFRGHEHLALTRAEARHDRLGAEGGEQRREDAEVLERPKRAQVKLGDAARQREHPIALADAEASQDVREPVGLVPERGVAEVPDSAVPAEPAERQVVCEWPGGVTIDRLVRDVEAAAAGQPVEHEPGRVPREAAAGAIVVREVRTEPQRLQAFRDRRIGVRALPGACGHRFQTISWADFALRAKAPAVPAH